MLSVVRTLLMVLVGYHFLLPVVIAAAVLLLSFAKYPDQV